ncbi:26S proteasome regulatory complex non-ATPase subcomplex Rpn1 subunit [Artomyces pyxidatus]|uniref:26S proteasome regulatory complex non-ATPase subcomplex Rpn1 subunit n=1 Tax=Artomyces pyxidatus TaxID=48021 RepID=A0ACB8T8X5_9AGAM|nr:26S proteasome regulatory complex non-ATPase subcomplex Rpn1 subunit [Artomyces pyxidatus]
MPEPTDFVVAPVPSDDPEKKEKPVDQKTASKPKPDAKEGDEMSEEDLQLRGELEMLVERLKESDISLYRPALETLRTLIRTSTSSMTSVPKPLKFLRPHYPDLQTLYESWPPSEDKSLFADILSVLAMTYSDTEPRGTLRYRLLAASLRPSTSPLADPGDWGHEYVRHLASELGEEYTLREQAEVAEAVAILHANAAKARAKANVEAGLTETPEAAEEKEKEKIVSEDEKKNVPLPVGTLDDLCDLAMVCAKFLLGHNAEPDAVDLLEELEIVNRIVELVDENTYARVTAYMIACVNLLPPQDDVAFLKTAHTIYEQHQKFPEALSLAIRLNDPGLIEKDFHAPGNPLMKRQLAFILARAQVPLHWLQLSSVDDDGEEVLEDLPDDLQEILYNSRLSTHFRQFGKEVGVEEAKSLEDVYKTHLETTRSTAASVDSARGNLAGTFVNAFVNAGFGNDKLMVEAEEGSSWIYKNKEHGMLSAAASLGVSLLWDTDVGLSHVDKYTYSSEEYIKAGALLATGILNSGVRSEADAALALLGEQVTNKSVPLKTSAIVGLGFAYAGSHRDDLLNLLLPFVSDDEVSMEIAGLAALSVGFIFVGSENGDASSVILQCLMEREDSALEEKWARFMGLGLALLYVGVQASDGYDATIETLKAIPHPVSKQIQILVEMCAFAGTGNVLRIQSMLQHCGEHLNTSEEPKEKEKEGEKKEEEPRVDDTFQAFAVLGIALVAMGEDIGAEMSFRQFNHLMHYGDPVIRKTVPLALGLISASNPQLPVLDTLSKYSHDNDLAVALNAIFAMGLVGAGTNNARLAQMLRQLAGYYHKEPDCLFMVRIAQGMVHMGKGTIGINPFFLDRTIMSKTAVAGLLATLTAFTDAKAFVLDKYHWMLYFLVPAMYPRFLISLDEELEPKPVTVRVGTAVDVVGQAGKPRTISGFQTYQTPVRLATTERAELATEEFIPFASVLEGFVLLQKNPGWEREDKMDI